jgi:hypothetical protein
MWLGIWIGSLCALVLLIVFLPKGNGQKHPGVRAGKPTDLSVVQPEVPVTPRERRAVNDTLASFIRTGVARADPAAAWELVTPAMRTGISRDAWNRGELPVTPYPAHLPKRLDWTVTTSYKGDLTLDLLLQPREGVRRGPIAFSVELKRARDGRWLVDSMAPEQVFSPVEAAPSKGTKPQPKSAAPAYSHGRLSPLWFAIPGALLGLVILVPLSILLLSWRRSRAIERRYRRERGY